MNLRIGSKSYPSGRCLLLAKALHHVSQEDGLKCLDIAQRTFDFQYPPNKEATLPVVDATKLPDLETLCAEYGIFMFVEA